ncbi:caspase family protein [Streptomyces sp. NPDC048595]|uniref:caspase, EACC1-associated type n=1 Tax=Streptomyces sp. NPDC048595 TaxID=3365576 RepID=UPI003711F3F7
MSPDRSRSRAILIGTSHYRDPAIRPLPADTCVSAMASLLTGERCGWPRDRLTTIEDIDSPRDAVMELVPQVREVTDVLLVYYVGHGMRTRDGQLALALTGTVGDPEVLPDSALLYPRLLEVLRGSPAATKLVILDCCHAELGLDADFHFQSGPADLAGDHPVDGLYFIGASTRYQKAKAPIGGRLTHFTHALIDVVETGIPGKPADLTLQQIFVEARGRLLRAGLPQPVDGGVRDAYQLPFARNAAARTTTDAPPPPDPRPATGPLAPGERSDIWRPGRRALLFAGLGATAAAVAVPLGLSSTSSPGGTSPDGQTAAAAGARGTRPARTPYATLHERGVMHAAFSPDSDVLAIGTGDGTIALWDVATRQRKATLTDFTGPAFLGVVSVAFSPDGTVLAGVDSKERGRDSRYDGTISLWDVATRKRLTTLTDTGVVRIGSVAFSPKGAILASANGIGTISIWSVAAHAKIATLTSAVAGAHTATKEVNSLAFSPDGAILAGSTVAGLVELWDGATYAKTATLAGAQTGVGALAFSPDGKVLAGAAANKAVHLWDVATHKEIATLTYTDDDNEGAADIAWSLAFSPDGAVLAGGTQAGLLLLWDVAGRKLVRTLGRFTSYGSSDSVSVAFSPDGRILAGVLSGKVHLWKLH